MIDLTMIEVGIIGTTAVSGAGVAYGSMRYQMRATKEALLAHIIDDAVAHKSFVAHKDEVTDRLARIETKLDSALAR